MKRVNIPTLACWWMGPLEGEFLLPWDAAFTPLCLFVCYRETKKTTNMYMSHQHFFLCCYLKRENPTVPYLCGRER